VFLGCIRRFQLRARLGPPWRRRLSPLTDPTEQDYRSGFLKRDSPHQAKNAGYAAATRDVSVGWLHISPRSSRFHGEAEEIERGSFLPLPLRIFLCISQPEREIHRARENDEEAVSTGPKGDCRMVPGEPPPACGEAAENPKRQTPGPLPVLRAINELPESPAVQSRGPAHLA